MVDRDVNVPVFKRRDILVHAHIFKNAGTTIDWILERNLGMDFSDDRNDERMVKEDNYLLNVIKSNADLKAISSHSMPLPIRENDHVNFHTLVMLRHPLLRVRSVYQFERKQRANTPGAKMAKKLSFRDYVEWRMASDVSPTIRDMQVRYLTRNSHKSRENLSEDHFSAASQFVNDNRLVGLVERFDQSMLLFSRYLTEVGIDLDFSYQKQNVSAAPKVTKSQQIDSLKEDLGLNLYGMLVEKNSMDMRLYEYADQLIVARFEKLDNVEEEIEALNCVIK